METLCKMKDREIEDLKKRNRILSQKYTWLEKKFEKATSTTAAEFQVVEDVPPIGMEIDYPSKPHPMDVDMEFIDTSEMATILTPTDTNK